jgi:Protein of unknown function (DUF2510)
VVTLSGPQLVFVLIFDAALAFLGFRLAEADKRSLGRTPWGVTSLGWAAIWFISPLLGFVLWFVAHRAEVRRAGRGPLGPMGPMGRAPAVPMPDQNRSVGSDFPAYPRPAGGGTHAPVAGSPQPPPAPPAPPVPPTNDAPPPGWHPDPGGRFHYRWWTGSEWTSYVATHGQVEVDTNPDQRIGPY